MRRQVPIFELLRKFDGERLQDDIKAGRRRYRVTRLPAFLILHMKRFTKNNFFLEKNPTIVNFPVRNLELADVVPVPDGARSFSPTEYIIHPARSLHRRRCAHRCAWFTTPELYRSIGHNRSRLYVLCHPARCATF